MHVTVHHTPYERIHDRGKDCRRYAADDRADAPCKDIFADVGKGKLTACIPQCFQHADLHHLFLHIL